MALRDEAVGFLDGRVHAIRCAMEQFDEERIGLVQFDVESGELDDVEVPEVPGDED